MCAEPGNNKTIKICLISVCARCVVYTLYLHGKYRTTRKNVQRVDATAGVGGHGGQEQWRWAVGQEFVVGRDTFIWWKLLDHLLEQFPRPGTEGTSPHTELYSCCKCWTLLLPRREDVKFGRLGRRSWCCRRTAIGFNVVRNSEPCEQLSLVGVLILRLEGSAWFFSFTALLRRFRCSDWKERIEVSSLLYR